MVGRAASGAILALALAASPARGVQSFEATWNGLIDLDRRCEDVASAPVATQRALPDGAPQAIVKDRVLVDPHEVGIGARERLLAARLDLPSVEDGWFTFAARLRSSCDETGLTAVYPSLDADSAEYTITGRADSIDVALRAGWLYANVSRLGPDAHATVTVGGRSFPVRPQSPTEIGVGVSGTDTVLVVRRGSVTLSAGGSTLVVSAGQEWRASRGDVLQQAPDEALRSIDRIGIEEWMGWPSRAWRAFRERPLWQQGLVVGLVGWGAFELLRSDPYEPPFREVDVGVRFP